MVSRGQLENKSFIQFALRNQQDEITFKIEYDGYVIGHSKLNFLFYSKVVLGRVDNSINSQIFDLDEDQHQNQILYLKDLNLNDNNLKGLADPTVDGDANKKYVDDETSDLLKLDGSRAMTGTLDLGAQRVTNIKPFVEDDSSQPASDAQKNDLVNWGKIHEIRGDLRREINKVASESLSRTDNGDKMEVNLNMNNNKINNLADPITGTDALNRNFGSKKIFKSR